MEERILKMTNDGIYINNYDKVLYQQTNLPIRDFIFIKEVFWKVAIKSTLFNSTNALLVDVLDYNIKNPEAIGIQKLKGEIPFMIFLPFEYEKLKHQVACHKSGIMRSLCKDHPLGSKNPIHQNIKPPVSDSLYTSKKQLEKEEKKNELESQPFEPAKPFEWPIEVKEFNFNHRFEKATIKNQCIDFKKQLQKQDKEITISINNEFFKKEYELIKEYIAKRLGKKTFSVRVVANYRANKLESLEATSEDIDKINETFIEEIRNRQIHLLRQVDKGIKDKKLYTVEEVFSAQEDFPGNVFNNDVNDIIQILTEGNEHRNSQQILFLAKEHKAEVEIVRLTLKPLFGFVFYIETESNHNYIWELLDSHATYIWSFSKKFFSLSDAYTNTDLFIKEVHELGRNAYKRHYNANQSNYQCRFTSIDHDMNNDISNENIGIWIEELKRIII